MSELLIKPVENLTEALDIAQVRNMGREFMTHDDRAISVQQQIEWYRDYLPANENLEAFAFAGYLDGEPSAYGLITLREEDYWLTGVLSPLARGKGMGEQLFRHLAEFVFENALSGRVMLDVMKTNERALRLYHRLGFTALTDDGYVYVMELNKEDYEPRTANV